MKIQSGILNEDSEDGGRFILMIDGKEVLSIGRGEPEDTILLRDLRGVLKVPEMLKAAHAAGVRGEPLQMDSLPAGIE